MCKSLKILTRFYECLPNASSNESSGSKLFHIKDPPKSNEFEKCILKDLHKMLTIFSKIADLQARSAALGAAL